MQLDHKVICQFRFTCSEHWDGLMPIDGDAKKRFCAVCKSSVYLTSSYEELEINVASKRCVAIFLKNPNGTPLEYMGDIQPSVPRSDYAVDPLFTRPIDELELTESTTETLQNYSVKLIGDLVICTQQQLVDEFGIGDSQMDEIAEALASRGCTTGMQLKNWATISAKYR